jgi:copper chaperone CopZ
MRKVLPFLLIWLVLVGKVQAETIKVTINGLVCSFCATGIKKTFSKIDSVTDTTVDLDSKLVTLKTKQNQEIDDKTITQLISDAGYTVTKITRDQ